MVGPTRKTRRRLAYGMSWQISVVIVWMMLPGDIGSNEMALAIAIIPSLVTGLVAFIIGETYSDHSARKHKIGE